jgi:cytochrome c5
MSHGSHSGAEAQKKSNPVGLAIAVSVGLLALILAIAGLASFSVGSHKLGSTHEKANSPETISKNIAPLVTLAVDASKGPVPSATATPTAAAPAATAASKAPEAPIVAAVIPAAAPAGAGAAAKPAGGEGVYKSACTACHTPGIAGAPKSGDKAAWAPRIAQGKPTLYDHAIKGFQGKGGVMPAKGGNASLSDEDVKAAVDYMIALNK